MPDGIFFFTKSLNYYIISMNKYSFKKVGDRVGRSNAKNEQIKEATKIKIKNGALLCFAKYGYAGVKISDLAKYIGISQGLLYRYYPSKEALFDEIIREWVINRDNDYDALLQAPITAKEKIEEITKHLFEELHRSNTLACIFTILENRCLVIGFDDIFNTWCSKPLKMLVDLLEAGQRDGSVHEGSCEQMSFAYWGLFSAICRDYLSSNGDLSHYDFHLLNRLLLKES